jgi:hypothetical protein
MEKHGARLEKARRRLEEQELLVAVYRHVDSEQSGVPSEVSGKMLQAGAQTGQVPCGRCAPFELVTHPVPFEFTDEEEARLAARLLRRQA